MHEKVDMQKKVLLIKLSSLGDVIFNIPLANALKKSGFKIDWLVSEKGLNVLENNPCVDNVILAPFVKWKKVSFLKSLKEYFSIIKRIRNEKYDIVIDTQGRWKSLIFMLFSNSKRRIAGSDGKELSKLGANEIVKIPKGWDINVVDKYLLYAKYLGIKTDSTSMSLPETTDNTKSKVNELIKDLTDKPLIVACPATTWKTKHWDKDNWKVLLENFENKYNIVLTGIAKDYEYLEYINQGKFLNLAGKTNLPELVELFRKCDMVISLDSGSTHLARAASAKSIISIFCSTPETYYSPIGEKYISLAGNLKCHPCHKRICKNKGQNYLECTKLPTPEEVSNIVNKLLNEV